MGRFVGIADAKLDDKNRVAIPVKFRHEFGDGAVYLRAIEEGCIAMYTEASFEETAAQVKLAPQTTLEGRRAWRDAFANTERVVPDSQGRVVIPGRLLQKVNLTGPGELVVSGSFEWVEIWPAAVFNSQEGEG